MKARETKKNKLKELQLLINDEVVDLPMRIDPSNGRVQFQKVIFFIFRNIFAKLGQYLIHQIFQMMKDHNGQHQDKNDYHPRDCQVKVFNNSKTNQKISGNSLGSLANDNQQRHPQKQSKLHNKIKV